MQASLAQLRANQSSSKLHSAIEAQRRERAQTEAAALREQLAAMTTRTHELMSVVGSLSPDDLAMRDERMHPIPYASPHVSRRWAASPPTTSRCEMSSTRRAR